MSEKLNLYLKSAVLEKNISKGTQIVNEMIVEKDADTGKACGSLAYLYMECQDYTNAFHYATHGSELGDANSYRCLADLYYDGMGIPQNFPKAYSYLLKAKDAGDDTPNYILELYKEKAKVSKDNEKQGCYIATCVYGSYDCPQVWTLRRYRDFVLANTCCGKIFIKLYYAISPQIVKTFGKNIFFKAFWRSWLDKKVAHLNDVGISNNPYDDRR